MDFGAWIGDGLQCGIPCSVLIDRPDIWNSSGTLQRLGKSEKGWERKERESVRGAGEWAVLPASSRGGGEGAFLLQSVFLIKGAPDLTLSISSLLSACLELPSFPSYCIFPRSLAHSLTRSLNLAPEAISGEVLRARSVTADRFHKYNKLQCVCVCSVWVFKYAALCPFKPLKKRSYYLLFRQVYIREQVWTSILNK